MSAGSGLGAVYTWRGITRNGEARTGQSVLDFGPAPFAETFFKAGYRRLTVTRDGRTVAAIERIDGKRVWWAEQ